MKQVTIGVFKDQNEAEQAIDRLINNLDIDTTDISYAYRTKDGTVESGEGDDLHTATPGEGAAKGAAIGGGIGAAVGLATVIGAIPVIGPLFAAGPLATALGLTGGVATTAAGAATGAAAGGIIGALTNMGIGEDDAERYEERVRSGNILIAAYSDIPAAVEAVLEECGAREIATSSANTSAYAS